MLQIHLLKINIKTALKHCAVYLLYFIPRRANKLEVEIESRMGVEWHCASSFCFHQMFL